MFIHSSVDELLDYFQFLVIMNNAVNTQTNFCVDMFSSLMGRCLWVELWEYVVVFWGTASLFYQVATSLCIFSNQCVRVPICAHPYYQRLFVFFILAILVSVMWF